MVTWEPPVSALEFKYSCVILEEDKLNGEKKKANIGPQATVILRGHERRVTLGSTLKITLPGKKETSRRGWCHGNQRKGEEKSF